MIRLIKWISIMLIGMEWLIRVPEIKALSVSTQIPEKYAEIQAGERIYFEIDIKYPENPIRKDLRLNYEVTKDQEIMAQSQVLKAVETQASFLDSIVIPENSKTGLYNLKVKISDDQGLNEEVSSSFQVIGSKDQEFKTYFLILAGVLSLVTILVIMNIVAFRRKK